MQLPIIGTIGRNALIVIVAVAAVLLFDIGGLGTKFFKIFK